MADVDAILGSLTLDEKAALTAGEDFFTTPAIDRVGVPKVRLTDGPNGARGTESFPGLGGTPSACAPSGTALGATWDPAVVQEVGAMLGREAVDRGCRVLLAPTVNLHRSPLGGRNFECYSEDPLLTGRLAVGYVTGVQSEGVIATIKHFVGNDAEFERGTISSVIDDRSLRELYLLPFELAVRDAGVLGLMTSYNRLNGRWLTEQRPFLIDLLRGEWGFDGLVMTDWFATVDTDVSLGAGLDLEMPGPGRALGATVVPAVEDGRVDKADLDDAVRRLLSAYDRIGILDAPTPPIAPQLPSEADIALLRRASAESIVLLKNDGALPLEPPQLTTVALIGPNAQRLRIMGGGSAGVILHKHDTFVEAVSSALGDGVGVVTARGCEADLSATVVGVGTLSAPEEFTVEVYDGVEFAGAPSDVRTVEELRLFVFCSLKQDWPEGDFSLRVRGSVVPEETGTFELALAQAGRARVFVDGDLVLDGFTNPPPPGGTDFFGRASQELLAEVRLEAGRPAEVVVEYARIEAALAGFRVGFRTPDGDRLIESAVDAARAADVALVVVGTSEEWETEGRDRTTFVLPGRQDELVRAVAAANPRTVVVVNAGAPVDLPWVDDVAAVLQCWFGGQELAGAVAEVITGRAEPGGRLPTTIPVRLEHNPSHDNFPGENGELRYGEGLFMGYRGYEHRCIEPRFAFGYGLSYTTFDVAPPELSHDTFTAGSELTVSVAVTNTGQRAGSHVVQCYIAPVAPRLARPPKELKAFAKVWLAPGETQQVNLVLDDRSFAYWDPGYPDREAIAARSFNMMPTDGSDDVAREPGWQVDPGQYDVLVGSSSTDIIATTRIELLPSQTGSATDPT